MDYTAFLLPCRPQVRRYALSGHANLPSFKVALAVDGSELSSRKVPKLLRRYNCLKKKIKTMADPTPNTNTWVYYVCHYKNSLDVLRCTMCATPQTRGSCSVLIVAKNSTHPAAVAARGSLGSRPPSKARGAAHTAPCVSPRVVQRIRRISKSRGTI